MSDQAASPTVGSHTNLIAATRDWTLPLFLALFGLSLVPILAVPIPAMVDYVNHLARMYVLAADGTPQASPYYRVAWALYPNLAMDLIVPRLAHFVGVELATRLFLLASQILVVTGAIAIEWAVKRRFAISGYTALMILYSPPFAWGFVNFEFALGVALWGIALWLLIRDQPWPRRFALHAIVCALLFLAHLFALGLYGIALGLHEFWRWRSHRAPPRELLATGALLALPVMALVGLMRATGGSVGKDGNAWNLAMKPLWLFASLNGYSIIISAVSSVALALLVYRLAKAGALRWEASGAWLAIGFAALFLVIPDLMLGTALVDLRVLVAAALILPAFLTIDLADPGRRIGIMAIIVAIILANVGAAAFVNLSYRGSYADMIGSFAKLRRGAHILVASRGAEADPPFASLADYPMYHAPTLAVHYADAFVPTLFTTEGKQPVQIRTEKDRRLSNTDGGPAPIALLTAAAKDPQVAARLPRFVQTWTRDYDYLYVLGPPGDTPMPDLLEPIEAHSRFTLYRLKNKAP